MQRRMDTQIRSPDALCFAVLAGLAAVAVASFGWVGRDGFARILGPVPPVAAILIAGLTGAAALFYLDAKGWLLRVAMTRRGVLILVTVTTGLAVLTILSDVLAPYPQGINVPLPDAALFYPAIALVAESVFHLCPVVLILGFAASLQFSRQVSWSAAVICAALIEPVFQVAAGFGEGPLWRHGFLLLHNFAFNLLQLWYLRRHGILAMVSVRLVYYLHWHILWGAARLELLF